MLVTLSLSGRYLNAPAMISEYNREFSLNQCGYRGLRDRIPWKISVSYGFQAVLDFMAVVS